jgi:hypothetical protein
MPQLQLPIFPDGLTPIAEDLAFLREDGKAMYFHGRMPVFQHGETDLKRFRMFTSQLIANGTARQRDIVQAFGVPLANRKPSSPPGWRFKSMGTCGYTIVS